MKKLLQVPLYILFDNEEEDMDDESPFPSLDEMIAYLREAVVLDLNTEEYRNCDGAPCVSLEVVWNEATEVESASLTALKK
jgi:hypothetical protein